MKIKSFLAVAKTGKFTDAGYQLYISQQAVSKNVADLERDIGVALFRRDHNNASLTGEGQKLFTFFDESTRAYNDLLRDIRASQRNQPLSNIRIGYQDLLDFGSAPVRAFKRLRQSWPDVMLIGEHIQPGELLKKLDAGLLDVILVNRRFIPQGKSGLQVLPLFQTEMVIGAVADHPLIREGTTWLSFREEPLLIDAIEDETEDDVIRKVSKSIRKFGFKPKEIIILPNRETIYAEAELGRGVFFASGIALIPNSSRLKIYPTDIREDTCCVWKEKKKNNLASQFVEYLCEEYSNT